jgi:uncharacterized protein
LERRERVQPGLRRYEPPLLRRFLNGARLLEDCPKGDYGLLALKSAWISPRRPPSPRSLGMGALLSVGTVLVVHGTLTRGVSSLNAATEPIISATTATGGQIFGLGTGAA